jgi:hypothetical protein
MDGLLTKSQIEKKEGSAIINSLLKPLCMTLNESVMMNSPILPAIPYNFKINIC